MVLKIVSVRRVQPPADVMVGRLRTLIRDKAVSFMISERMQLIYYLCLTFSISLLLMRCPLL